MLAARLEEYYIQLGQEQEIKYIAKKIVDKLKADGLEKTAHHAYDYLEDKYKHSFQKSTSGLIAPENLIEDILRKDPIQERSKEEIQHFEEYCKHLDTEREANRQAAKQRNIALDDTHADSLGRREWPEVHTKNPHLQYDGPVHEALSKFTDELGGWHKDMQEVCKDVYDWYDPTKVPEKPFIKTIEMFRGYIFDMRRIIAPSKDLKYATSMHNWFHTLLKFLAHGKHAAGVMTKIPAAEHMRKKSDGTEEPEGRDLTREQVGDRVPWVEDLLHSYAHSKALFDDLKSFFRATGEWDRDDRLRRWRAEFNSKVIRAFADNGDFLNHLSFFRQQTMDDEVADRRIDLRDPLSDYA